MLPSTDSTVFSPGRLRLWRTRIAAGGLVAAGTLVFGSTITVQQGCAKVAPAPSSAPPILVGVSFGLTKGLSAFSKPLRNAVKVAEGDINAAGGVLGRPITFDVQDDQSDEDQGIVERVANDFVSRGAVAVIGPIGSQQVVKTQAIYAAAQMIQISPSATSTVLTTIQPDNNRWLFRTTPADDFQGAAVLLFAQKTPRGLDDAGTPPPVGDGGTAIPTTCAKLAIVNVDNAYGNSMAEVITKNRMNHGDAPILQKKVSVTLAASYSDLAASITAANPDCMAMIMYDDVGVPFVRAVKADPGYAALASKGFFFIGTDGVFTDGFLTESRQNPSDPTSPNTAEGVYGTNPDTQPGTPAYNEFRAIYSSFYPVGTADAPAFAANTYDAAVLIALAIQRAGTVTDRNLIRQKLLEVANPPGRPYTPGGLGDALNAVKNGDDIDYTGGSGDVDIEPNGNVKSGFIVWQAYRDSTKSLSYRTVARFPLADLVAQLK